MDYNERKVSYMTERQLGLLKDYGPRFMERSDDILTNLLHLAPDAISVMTDEEWKECAEALTDFQNKLEKVRVLVAERLDDNGIEW